MDTEIQTLLAQVRRLGGAVHADELPGAAVRSAVVETAVAAGLLERRSPGFLVAPGTDERIVTARHLRGYLTCASAAEVLGYPLAVGSTHVAIPVSRPVRPSRTRPLTGIRIHHERQITPMVLNGFPLVVPAEVVARCLICLDAPTALVVADAAPRRGDVRREEVEVLLKGRRRGLLARRILASASR